MPDDEDDSEAGLDSMMTLFLNKGYDEAAGSADRGTLVLIRSFLFGRRGEEEDEGYLKDHKLLVS